MNEENRKQIYPPTRIEVSPPRQLLILFGLLCFGLLLGGLVSFFMIHLTPGATFTTINDNPAYGGLLKWIQALGTFCMFAVPALLFNLILRPAKDYFHVRQRRSALLWVLVVLMAFCAIPTSDLFSRLNTWIPISEKLRSSFQQMETNYDQQMMKMLSLRTFGQYISSMVLIALLPALFEELFFRGTLQQIFIRWFRRPFWAILLTSVLFSAVHMSYFGFLPRVFLGILMGYIFYRGKSIWLNITIHFINNGLVITLLYISYLQKGSLKEHINYMSPVYLEIIGLLALLLLLNVFGREAGKQADPADPHYLP